MQLKKRKITELKHASYNPRKDLQPADEEYQKIKRSIDEFGYVEPIIINSDNTIIGGHQRVKVLADLGYEDIDVIIVELDKAHEKALNVALNKISGEWDFEKLNLLLMDLKDDIDATLTGFDNDEIQGMLDSLKLEEDTEEDDFDVEEEIEKIAEAVTQMGDIWQLGRHRLMCGDSTAAEQVSALLDNKQADMVFTDPPYGMKKEKDGVLNDNLNYDDLLEFNKKWIAVTFNNLKDNGSWYCWGIDEPLMDIYSNILKPMQKQQKITFRNLITWDKGNGQGQMAKEFRMYPVADEKCLFIMCGVQGFNNNADNYFEGWEPVRDYLLQSRLTMGWDVPTMKRIAGHSDLNRDHWTSKSQFNFPTKEVYNKLKIAAEKQRNENKSNNDAFKKEYDELKKEYDELKKEYYSTRAYFNNTHDNMNNVWHFARTSGKEKANTGGHATPKPIALCSRAILSSSQTEESVLDVFGGSGSTLIACEQLNRDCYMMELEPKYCDVIIKRWEEYTGSKAIKIN